MNDALKGLIGRYIDMNNELGESERSMERLDRDITRLKRDIEIAKKDIPDGNYLVGAILVSIKDGVVGFERLENIPTKKGVSVRE